jgi:hypothetical protein
MTNQELRDYQAAAFTTAIYPDAGKGTSLYPYLALCEEAGEVAGLFAKRIRDGERPDFRDKLRKELGDVLWQCAAIATEEDRELTIETHKGFVGDYSLRLCEAAICHDVESIVDVVNSIAGQHGMTLLEVADANLAKLASRAERGTLSGSGDDR